MSYNEVKALAEDHQPWKLLLNFESKNDMCIDNNLNALLLSILSSSYVNNINKCKSFMFFNNLFKNLILLILMDLK